MGVAELAAAACLLLVAAVRARLLADRLQIGDSWLVQLDVCPEAALDALPTAGLSADYVARETKRALAGVQGKCKIYPGIDIGIPTGKNSRKASLDDTYAATAAALKAGAHGVIFSRKYSEMRLANLEAAGRAVREFKG